jgi:DNA-binding NtrC family response regulator
MEDEVNVAKGLQMVLDEEGYSVDVEMTGQGALEKFHQRPFDLLVADLRLPDIDGMEVIRQVKNDRPETDVIVITGYSSVASAVEAMKMGVREYLPKPFTEDEFKEAVHVVLKDKVEADTRKRLEAAEAHARLIQVREVRQVLNRASEDKGFWRDLMELGPDALEPYQITSEAKAAIISGDLKWLNQNVGELTQKQLMFIHKMLEREIW